MPENFSYLSHNVKKSGRNIQDLRKITKNVDAERLAAGYRKGRKVHKEIRVSESFCVSPNINLHIDIYVCTQA
ncbi:hypothetical protein NIES25_43370 [Nostoc linckia NIES-25]|nr:hypothetical protein NIES25_43370 [Nostoc linckia NIES-25]